MDNIKPKLRQKDWLRLENRIRGALIGARRGDLTPVRALEFISNIIGEETGQGYELPIDWAKDMEKD